MEILEQINELLDLNPEIEPCEFKNGEEFLDALDCGDYYNPITETYVYVYNDCGSICFYSVDVEYAKELIKKQLDWDGEYWGAFLGRGGSIVDSEEYDEYEEGDCTPLDWCEGNYEGIWLKVV